MKGILHEANTLHYGTINVGFIAFGLLWWENGSTSPVDHSPTSKVKEATKR